MIVVYVICSVLERFALQGHFYISARGIFICPNFI